MKRLFVANRGEIAVRILTAAQAVGLETVLGVSSADRNGLAAELADRVVVLGPAKSERSYLDENLTVQAAKSTGCDALHPGYGFLSERASLARLCESAGIVFVGPRPETIEALGDKLNARQLAAASEVPLLPGTSALQSMDKACAEAEDMGYPVVIKASAGGGGRGMFLANRADDIRGGFTRASEEARAAFGNGLLYMERFIENARHVEVQVFGDGKGKVVHFGERDCSVQRRYQKLIEESPCGVLPQGTRSRLHAAAVKLTTDLAYRNAGTVEFLHDADRDEFYFPGMATPFSQLVGIQAVLNLVTGERYKIVPDEVIQYAAGYYGEPVAPIDAEILDRIMASPRAGKVLESPPEEPTLEELYRRYGTRNPDELILRALMPEPDLQKMRAAGPVQQNYPVMSTPVLEQARQLMKVARSPFLQIKSAELNLKLRRGG